MGQDCKIEWTDATANPIRARNRATGKVGHFCVKVSPGCAHCFAERLQVRFGNRVRYIQADADKVELFLDRVLLDKLRRTRAPRRVFWQDMSDLFHPMVPFEWIAEMWRVFHQTPHLTHQVLTKHPDRMAEFLARCGDRHAMGWITHDGTRPRDSYGGTGIIVGTDKTWPLPNVWLGTSVEDQERDYRIRHLLNCPATVRFLSVEPLLGPLDLSPWLPVDDPDARDGCLIDWVIVGGESGPGARPMHPDWVRDLRDQTQAAGVAFFFKQWGAWAPACDYYEEEDDIRERALDQRHLLLSLDGRHLRPFDRPNCPLDGQPPLGTWVMHRVGKKAAGRVLDGRTWDQLPKGAA